MLPSSMWSSRRPGQATTISTPAPQRRDLVVFAHAAVNGNAAHPALSAQADNGIVDLFGEFPRRGENQSAHLSRRAFGQPLQYGQDEGCRLAGAGLCQAHDIAPLEHDRNCLTLNGGWCGVTNRLDGGGDMGIERKLFEIQKVLLGSIEPSCTLSPMMLAIRFATRSANPMFAPLRKYSSRRSALQVGAVRRPENARTGKRSGQSASDWCIIYFVLANRASQISDAIHPHDGDSIFL